MRRPWLAGVLLAACLLPYAGATTALNDELTLMSDGLRILHGEVPYRDFFEFLGPLAMGLLAAAYAVWGASLRTTHWITLLILAVAAHQTQRIGRRLGLPGAWAWLPAFGLVTALFSHWACYSHHWAVLPFELGAFEYALIGLATTRRTPWLAAGGCLGLAGLVLQTDGAGLGLALAVGMLLEGASLAQLGALVAGALAPLAIAATWLGALGALSAAWADVVRWPLSNYRIAGGINDVPFGSDLPIQLAPVGDRWGWGVRAYQVLATYALVLGSVGVALGQRTRPTGFNLLACWMLVSVVLATRGRADYVHVSEYAVPALLGVTLFAYHLRQRAAAWLRWLPAGLLVAYCASALLMLGNAIRKEPAHWGHFQDPDARLRDAPVMQYLRARARPGDTMAAMPYGGYYYFYGPRPATPYTLMLNPEVGYGSPGEFADFWARIHAARPRFIVVSPFPWTRWEEANSLYTRHLPPGYRAVATMPTPQFGPGWPATIYEAAAP